MRMAFLAATGVACCFAACLPYTIDRELAMATIVAEVRIAAASRPSMSAEVLTMWKGPIAKRIEFEVKYLYSLSPYYPPLVGKVYLVYLSKPAAGFSRQALWVTPCGRIVEGPKAIANERTLLRKLGLVPKAVGATAALDQGDDGTREPWRNALGRGGLLKISKRGRGRGRVPPGNAGIGSGVQRDRLREI